MQEWLAIPGPSSQPIGLNVWVERLSQLGHESVLEKEDSDAFWIEIAALRLRGFAMMEGVNVDAINFELHDPEPALAWQLLEAAASSLGWELTQEDDDDDD